VDNPGARRYLRDDATVVSDYPIRAVDHIDRGYTMNGSCPLPRSLAGAPSYRHRPGGANRAPLSV